MSDRLSELLAGRPYLLADGATGTNLFDMGLGHGDAPELWNLEHPERVARLHQMFVDAGADIILTNSFGGTRHRLKLHGAQERVAEINEAAARIARGVAGAAGRPVVVAGDMGPTGELFQPLGVLDLEQGAAAFAEQAQALARGGADVIWIETLSSSDEVEAAVTGAATTGLPVVCTASFDTNGRTMMGITPADFVRLCRRLSPSPVAYGANCGAGAGEAVTCLLNLEPALEEGAVVVVKANCGIPAYVDGAVRYDGTPELMAEYARLARDAGARIVGGCCGTTPGHLAAMRAALEGYEPMGRPSVETIVERLGEISAGARAQQAGGGERPPRRERGRRRQQGS